MGNCCNHKRISGMHGLSPTNRGPLKRARRKGKRTELQPVALKPAGGRVEQKMGVPAGKSVQFLSSASKGGFDGEVKPQRATPSADLRTASVELRERERGRGTLHTKTETVSGGGPEDGNEISGQNLSSILCETNVQHTRNNGGTKRKG